MLRFIRVMVKEVQMIDYMSTNSLYPNEDIIGKDLPVPPFPGEIAQLQEMGEIAQ